MLWFGWLNTIAPHRIAAQGREVEARIRAGLDVAFELTGDRIHAALHPVFDVDSVAAALALDIVVDVALEQEAAAAEVADPVLAFAGHDPAANAPEKEQVVDHRLAKCMPSWQARTIEADPTCGDPAPTSRIHRRRSRIP
ncbi:MAG: hypothetical protein NTY19_16860 [Planctomycetota bacterium]|nr:hypothetical protein [Planctomycetota bacterium]